MITVLVVDDSPFMRRALCRMLERNTDITVCGYAASGEEAIARALELRPDVITMDVEMPGMGGLEAVRSIVAKMRTPIVMVSSLTREGAETTLRALELGAVDFVPKPDSAYIDILTVARDLVAKVRALAGRKTPPPVSTPPAAPRDPVRKPVRVPRAPASRFECVVLGTSTGGPIALSRIIPRLPANFPIPIIVVQHMPPGFTRPLADRLATQSKIAVQEGVDGAALAPAHAYIAPAGKHLRVVRSGRLVTIALALDEGSSLHVPSVDVTAGSVGETFGAATLGVILTGMGSDGVSGLRIVKERGGYVVGQDEASSVVYGMPRAAAVAGLVDRVVALENVAETLCELTKTSFTIT